MTNAFDFDPVELFREEAQDHIAVLQDMLLHLEEHVHDEDALREIKRRFHSIKGDASLAGVQPIVVLAHSAEDLVEYLSEHPKAVSQACAALLHCIDMIARVLDTLPNVTGETEEQINACVEQMQQAREEKVTKEPPEPPAEEGASDQESSIPAVSSILAEQTSIRIGLDRIETLFNLVGEFLPSINQLENLVRALQKHVETSRGTSDQTTALERVRAIENALSSHVLIWQRLQREILRLRMFPLETLFRQFPRVVHDFERTTGKRARLVLSGQEILVDRTVIEHLKDPLLHMVRNALDHGIETSDERQAKGKPPVGRIELRARRAGNRVVVEIADDGRGIDRRAVAKAAGVPLDQAENLPLLDLLCTSGLTTKAEVSDVSGRGIGMDVVRASVERLHGSLELETEKDKGTTFRISVPLETTVVRSLLFQIADGTYATPLTDIVRIVEIESESLQRIASQNATFLDDEWIPVFDGRKVFGFLSSADTRSVVRRGLAVRTSHGLRTVLVDAILGQEDCFVRAIDPRLSDVPFLIGASLTGLGGVALHVDLAQLLAIQKEIQTTFPEGENVDAQEPPGKRPCILVAEDSKTTRNLERSLLESAGYTVLCADDGRQALDLLCGEDGRDIKLLVTDIQMPRMDGVELTRELRKREAFRSLPVLICTHVDSTEEKRRAMEAGADAYIVKSQFDPDEFVETVKRLLL